MPMSISHLGETFRSVAAKSVVTSQVSIES
jgi:hypothetical protein